MDLRGVPDLPRRIGVVENVGLQIPVISPDGQQMLYLRTDQDRLAPVTLLGSPDPQGTPPDGTLSIWIRPTGGASPGRELSSHRWAHSPVWSPSGRAVAYVVNEPPRSFLVHVDLQTGQETFLGPSEGLACLPRFDGDDRTLLFCAGADPAGPARIYRQAVGDPQPTPVSPDGADCVWPVLSDGAGRVVCARAQGEHLDWILAGPQATTALAADWGLSSRPDLLQTLAGIAEPLAPDRESLLFYDIAQDRVCTLQLSRKIVSRHRRGSIAACWLDGQAIALATADGLFLAEATTGVSTTLLSGSWIPCRYIIPEQRLILFGQQGPRHLAVWEIRFQPADRPGGSATPAGKPGPIDKASRSEDRAR